MKAEWWELFGGPHLHRGAPCLCLNFYFGCSCFGAWHWADRQWLVPWPEYSEAMLEREALPIYIACTPQPQHQLAELTEEIVHPPFSSRIQI